MNIDKMNKKFQNYILKFHLIKHISKPLIKHTEGTCHWMVDMPVINC